MQLNLMSVRGGYSNFEVILFRKYRSHYCACLLHTLSSQMFSCFFCFCNQFF